MSYKIEKWNIQQLINLYNSNKLNLNPSYQRNAIWNLKSQKLLIKTIEDGLPIPNFFLHKKDNDNYDMIDGQQRTRAVLSFLRKDFTDSSDKYAENSKVNLSNYEISVIVLEEIENEQIISDFYVLVNQSGIKVNRPEEYKAKYSNTSFLNLVEDLSDNMTKL